ncbi:hypothetical protein MKW98_009414 [Papaver atlanticum]|uniref:Uncharacterized protein n=1 Tax=Papaver atlanticum TaxID=357466 RepID=A0AAD4SHK9_9MAGN|nr:hypothetical protein MKW98_009414 [Papaver atlanticum]
MILYDTRTMPELSASLSEEGVEKKYKGKQLHRRSRWAKDLILQMIQIEGDNLKVLEATRREVRIFGKTTQLGCNTVNFILSMRGINTLTIVPALENSVTS